MWFLLVFTHNGDGMKIIKEGDTGRAVCECCGLTNTTYKLRDIPFSDNRGIVKGVLAGVCNACNEVIALPPQSVPRVKDEYMRKSKSLEARLPAHYIDILNVASLKIDASHSEALKSILILYYINGMRCGDISSDNLHNLLKSDFPSAPLSQRFSLKITEKTEKELSETLSILHFDNISDLIKATILKIDEDIVKPQKPRNLKQLQRISAALG